MIDDCEQNNGVDCATQVDTELEAEGAASRGGDNAWAASEAEVAVIAVPYAAHRATLSAVKTGLAGKVLIDITVPLAPPKVRQVSLPEGKAAALEAQKRQPFLVEVS